jgi:hypothetical protein
VVAPEPYLSACLAVLNRAILLGRNQPAEAEMVFDVMDAVHAIPEYIGHWDHCDEQRLRDTLQRCDNRWPSGLLAAYDFILERRVV